MIDLLLGPLVIHLATPLTASILTPDWRFLMSEQSHTRPWRNKNPGNLRAPSLAVAQRLYGKEHVVGLDDSGHVHFADWADGLAAVRQDVRVKVSGRSATKLPVNPSIAAFSRVYAEDPHHAAKLAALLQSRPTSRIGIDVQEEAFLRALIRLEGGADTWEAVQSLLG
jgi:hypothetical protein